MMTRKITACIVIFSLVFLLFIRHKEVLKYLYPVDFEAEVEAYSKEYNLDKMLVYSVIRAESKFNPEAKSSKGAIGLMQITPQTGRYISGLLGEKSFSTDMLFDPEVNIRYGCFYLAKLYKDFGGEMEYVLAAYNGGEGNVRKWLREADKEGRTLETQDIPFKETREYVLKVKNNLKLYRYIYE